MATTRSILLPLSRMLLERLGDEALAAVGAVVGADMHSSGRAHLVLQDEEVLGAGADDDDDLVAGLLHALGDGVQHGDPDAAADADDLAELLDVRGFPSGPIESWRTRPP